MPALLNILKISALIFGFLVAEILSYGQAKQFDVYWGTHHADDSTPALGEDYGVSTSGFKKYLLKSFDSAGTTPTSLLDNTDIIELGFFNIKESSGVYSGSPTDDNTDQSASYTPNTDTSNPFKGVWTPLTSVTKIGRDWDSDAVPAGEYYFHSLFPLDGEATETSEEGGTHNGLDSYTSFADNLGSAITGSSNSNALEDRVSALYAEGDEVLLGIRFYDNGSKTNGTTRYNTIMNTTDWKFDWDSSSANQVTATMDLLTYNDNGTPGNGADDTVAYNTNLIFEFDNPTYKSVSTVGTGGNAVDQDINGADANEDKFVATVTYYDGTGTLDLDDDDGIGHTILSGLNSGGTINVGDDNIKLTINAASGGKFESNAIISEGGSDGQANLFKTGTGEQVLTGSVKLSASATQTSSGLLDIYEGNLSLDPASAGTQKFEYLTNTSGGSGTPVLKLDNTDLSDGDELVQLGFAENTSATFSGDVVLDGRSASEIKVKISDSVADGTFAADDFTDKQIISGVVSHANGNKTLVKDGVGTLSLTGDNTFSGGVRVEDGTLSAGHADALGADSNTVTIKKGKLEVADGITLNSTYSLATDDSGKSMIGGRGDFVGDVTIGSAPSSNYVDFISPGDGISTSLSSTSTTQQVSLGERTNAIGEFTVGQLTLKNGGVYDWEISDFSESGVAGTDFDVLKFDSLVFDSSGTFTLNILGLQSDGSAGAVGGSDGVHTAGLQNLWDDSWNNASTKTTATYKGFKFLDGGSHASITNWGGVTSGGSAPTSSGGYIDNFFEVDQRGFSYHNNFWMGDWNVWYDGSGDFYLQFSAVPEPSTYVMVTGLLMVPGMSYIRRLRKKKGVEVEEENEKLI